MQLQQAMDAEEKASGGGGGGCGLNDPTTSVCSLCAMQARNTDAAAASPRPSILPPKDNIPQPIGSESCPLCRIETNQGGPTICKHFTRPSQGRDPYGWDSPMPRVTPLSDPAFCSAHPTKPLEIYCADCRVVICMLCFVESHQSHACSDVEKAAAGFRRLITHDLVLLSVCSSEGLARKEQRARKRTDFLREMEVIETAVLRRSEQLRRMVDRHAKDLLTELDSLKKKCANELEEERLEIEEFLERMDEFKTFCRRTKSKDAVVVCQVGNEIHRRADEICKMQGQCGHRRTRCITISFKTDEVGGLLKFTNIIGRLQVTSKLAQRKEQNPLPKGATSVEAKPTPQPAAAVVPRPIPADSPSSRQVKVQYASRISSNTQYIYGVAKLHNYLYVLFTNSVSIYQLNPFVRIKVLKIPDIRYGGDIATCQKTKCLYVLEHYRGIWRIETAQTKKRLFSQDHHRTTLWLSSVVHSPTLSITKDGHVLLIKEEKPLSSLEIFDENATLLKTIQLPLYVLEPRHAVATPTGNFVVSFGWSCGIIHGICEMNESGQLIHHYEPQVPWQLLRNPSHLAIDPEGRVFVADEWNNRVIRLDDQLHFDQIILSRGKDGFQGPFRLSFVVETNQLMVVHGCSASDANRGGNKVDVFNIK